MAILVAKQWAQAESPLNSNVVELEESGLALSLDQEVEELYGSIDPNRSLYRLER